MMPEVILVTGSLSASLEHGVFCTAHHFLGLGPYDLEKSICTNYPLHTCTSSQNSFLPYFSIAFALPRNTSVEYDFPCCGGWIAKRIALHLRSIFQHQVRCLRLEKGT